MRCIWHRWAGDVARGSAEALAIQLLPDQEHALARASMILKPMTPT